MAAPKGNKFAEGRKTGEGSGAPKGNKFAVGADNGRPQEYDRKKIAIDLIEWSKKDGSINLNKFCAYNDPIISPHAMLRWCREDEDFRTAYEQAKTFLGFRREEMLSSGELHSKAYDLNATVYDAFHRAEKITMDDMESDRKVKQVAAGTEEERAKNKAIMDQLDKLQAERSSDNNP
jgi:hypothetical protein